MAGLLDRFGLYGKQNADVSESYARSLAAQRSIIASDEAIDHRNLTAKLASPAGLARKPVAGSLSMGVPNAMKPQGDFDVGTEYTPTVGIAPQAAPTAAAAPQAAGLAAPQGSVASGPDGSPLPTLEQWKQMSPETQRNMYMLHLQKDIKTRGMRAKRPTMDEYIKSLPSDPAAMASQYAARGGKKDAPVAANITKNTHALIAQIPQASQTPQGQKIMEFARAIGVNPAVAMATYGMESSFGAQNRSWEEASRTGSGWGVLQVTPATARGVVKHFSKPEILEKYGNAANNINALIQMASGDPNSEDAQIAAGILQMKYIQDIGIKDESLMGAAYQANPHKVLKRGGPLDATDGNMSNSDYSANWNALFAQTNTALGGGPSTAPQPAATAGVVKTGNSSFDRRVKFAMQKPVAEYDFSTQQLMQSRELNNQLIQQQQDMFASEQRRVEQEYEASNTRFAAYKAAGDVAGMTAEMDKMAGAQALADDIQTRSYQFVISAQDTINQYNNQLVANKADHAVRALADGDPTLASAIVSAAGGRQRIYQKRTDGGYTAIDSNGQYVLDSDGQARKFSDNEIIYEVYSVADRAKAAAMDAGRASTTAASIEADFKLQLQQLQNEGTIGAAAVKGSWDLKQALQVQLGDIAEVKDTPEGGIKIIYKGGDGKIVTMNPDAVQATVDGTEIPTTGIKVEYSGLKTNG